MCHSWRRGSNGTLFHCCKRRERLKTGPSRGRRRERATLLADWLRLFGLRTYEQRSGGACSNTLRERCWLSTQQGAGEVTMQER